MNKVTIKDVAREAGVSISTVSNAMNGVDVLRPETKAHILEVAERLHYIPNLNGRNLKSSETKAIGFFISSMKGEFFGTVADAMYLTCESYGYELNIFITRDSNSIMNCILGKRIDGAIVLHPDFTDEHIGTLLRYNVPTVFLDREVSERILSSVVFDSYYAGKLAADYLIEKGHRTFGFIRGPKENYDSTCREKGFRETILNAGYEWKEQYIWNGEFHQEATYQSISTYLKQSRELPDAIFASNDYSAIGCMEALLAEGYHIPKEISIIGCDDISISSLFKPKLTTIQTSYDQIGQKAVQELIQLIRKEKTGFVYRISSSIIERETCTEKLPDISK